MEPKFPLEFVVNGAAVSLQAPGPSRARWQEKIRAAMRRVHPDDAWATAQPVAVTLYYFPENPMQGDIDNIVKPVLDALAPNLYIDDSQVERVVAQRFNPKRRFNFAKPSAILSDAIKQSSSALYVRVSNDPHEDLS